MKVKAKVIFTSVPAAAFAAIATLAPLSTANAAANDCRNDPFYDQKVTNGEPFYGCVLNGVLQTSDSPKPRGAEGPTRGESVVGQAIRDENQQMELWNRIGNTNTN